MTDFKLDTTGAVKLPPQPFAGGTLAVIETWTHLSPFTQGYIEALFADEGEAIGEAFAAEPHNVEPMGTGSRYRPGFADRPPG